jgi:hypothetical protein
MTEEELILEKKFFDLAGSPYNNLTRDPISKNFLHSNFADRLKHYAKSQASFAFHTTSSLIAMTKKFKREEIFNHELDNVLPQEIGAMEKIYNHIALARRELSKNSATTHRKFRILNDLDGNIEDDIVEVRYDPEYEDEKRYYDLMQYEESERRHCTYTNFVSNGRYKKYTKINEYETLTLANAVKALGMEPSVEDRAIELGKLEQIDDDNSVHNMGEYRPKQVDGHIDFSFLHRNKINRVDEITALAAKKALMTEDADEALRHAFIFAALRGYNTRSTIGACWAQEMSLRWVFAQRGWEQFNKMPGIYLDVEACLLDKNNPDQSFFDIISKMVSDYKSSLEPQFTATPSSLFDRPLRSNEKEFSRYLLETRKYSDQNLPDIISDLFFDEDQTAFHIAAQNGDRKFFKILNEKTKSNRGFCERVQALSLELNWDSVMECSSKYNDPKAAEEIASCRQNLEMPRTSFSVLWSFLYPGNAASVFEKRIEGSIRAAMNRGKEDNEKSSTR